MVNPDRMACLPSIECGEGSTGKDDEEIGCLEWISEFEQDNGSIRCGCFSTPGQSCTLHDPIRLR